MSEEVDKDFLNWFAGFVAGEGCFQIVHHTHNNSPDTWGACFSINLRDDDVDILLEIQDRLHMGRIYRRPETKGSPQAEFRVQRIEDLNQLVAIFEAHPLRAKKARAFRIWKMAVQELAQGRGGGFPATYNRHKLARLRNNLCLLITYQGPEEELSEPDEVQLEFWGEEDDK